jgi:cytochrome c peroxidase
MPRRYRSLLQPTRLAALALAAVASALAWSRADAHVVPPERLHPVTESYRRMGFLLSLNPVLWNEVGRDATLIADGLEAVEPDGGRLYRSSVASLLDAAITATGGSGPIPAAERRATARDVFHLSTGAVIDKLDAHLALARARLDEYGRASLELGEARALWAAFEPALQAIDAGAYREHGRRWLELTSALGTPGVLGAGAVAPDRETFEREAARLMAFLDATFRAEDAAAVPERVFRVSPALLPVTPAAAAAPGLLPPGSEINKQLPRPRQVLNMAVRGVDEAETPLVALGDMAFDSPEIFGEPARSLGMSCNTCHNKGVTNPRFFIPGLSVRPGGLDVSSSFFAPHAANGHFDPVDIPDLRGIRFTGPYGRNGRFASLREFTRNVIVNEFNGPEPEAMLLDGLVAYMLEFDFLPNAALAPDGKLTDAAAPAARRGEEIFHRPFAAMGGRSCASCHVPGDHFLDRRRHDVGTVGGAEAGSRDRALDTPTLLSAAFTAPYFHDGSAPTLRAVSGHFNDFYGLGLSGPELDDLTAYVETVGGGAQGYEDTVFTLASELEEFSFFLSTYELLKARGENELLDVTFKTIAFEVQAHKWDVQDEGRLPVLDRLTEIMVEAYEARRRGDLAAVDARVAEYRALYEDHAEVLQ